MGLGMTGWSGGPRVPVSYNLRAGQFRSMGRTNVIPSTTIINNNIYGAGYQTGGCCSNSYNMMYQDNGPSTFEKWMMGIGVGGTLIGGILGLFGKGKSEGAGGAEQPENTDDANSKAQKELLDELKKSNEELKKSNEAMRKLLEQGNSPAKAEPETKAKTPAEPETKADLQDGSITSVIDEALGDKATISGDVKNLGNGSYEINTGKYVFSYSKSGKVVKYNGKDYPVYTCTGAKDKNGKTMAITAQEYILIDGNLKQPKDFNGLKGLESGTIKH